MRDIRTNHFTAGAAVLCLSLILGACDEGSGEAVLARAADYELPVSEAVTMMTAAPRVPNDPTLVENLGELWVEYMLLAHAIEEDSTLSQVDLGPLVDQQADVEAILALREAQVRPDTAISDEDLEALYGSEGGGTEVRARHILLAFPPSANAAQQDSVRQAAEGIRQQLVDGADFAALAARVSDDGGSASRGGDLGWFQRGDMVRPFDEAVFALEPGELSDVVETPYGQHVIRLEERRVPEFADVRDDFRTRVLGERIAAAESIYVAGVMEGADIELAEDGLELVRQMAREPRGRLSRRAANRVVAEYQGGTITVSDVQDLMLSQSPQFRGQVVSASDELVEDALVADLVRRKRLLARAVAEGHALSQPARDSLTELARERFVGAARQLGLGPLTPQPGEDRRTIVRRTVSSMIREIIQGSRQPAPLGAIGWILRQQYNAQVYAPGAVLQVVQRVADARGPAARGAAPGATTPAPGAGAGGQPAPPVTPSDSVGGS